jgi:tripeptidyl-peptidase-1
MGVTNPLTNLSTQLYSGSASYAIQDMQTFAGLYNIKLGNITSQPYYLPTGDPEASLDMETATAVANGTQTVWWWAPGSWVFSMANTVFNTPNSPLVHSWSFGWEEDLQCTTKYSSSITACNFNSTVYIARTETELMKLAAIGMTVIVASGDQGIMSAANQQCPPTAGPYLASYPQTSAWVLTAGATMMSGSTPPSYKPEVVCSKATGSAITSGGGFSAYVPQPWWQAGVSDAYGRSQVSQGVVPASAFNVSYRGFPDVAALGHNFVVCDSSSFYWSSYT